MINACKENKEQVEVGVDLVSTLPGAIETRKFMQKGPQFVKVLQVAVTHLSSY